MAQIDYVCVLVFSPPKGWLLLPPCGSKETAKSGSAGVVNPGYLKLERAGKIQQALIMKSFFQLPKNIMS